MIDQWAPLTGADVAAEYARYGRAWQQKATRARRQAAIHVACCPEWAADLRQQAAASEAQARDRFRRARAWRQAGGPGARF